LHFALLKLKYTNVTISVNSQPLAVSHSKINDFIPFPKHIFVTVAKKCEWRHEIPEVNNAFRKVNCIQL